MKILIATDGSVFGNTAVRAAAERPWPSGSHLRVLTVIEYPPTYSPIRLYGDILAEARKAVERIATDAVSSLGYDKLSISHAIREGKVVDEIIAEARDWGADLILIGTHNRQGLSRFLHGSVAESVAADAPCSVEIVRTNGQIKDLEFSV
jgi:nucleotide-binding universal stress UspA family protein